MPGNKNLMFRMDVFNLLNTYIINNRNTLVTFQSPTNLTVVNSQFRADGSLDPARLTPRNAGFGAATGAITRGGEAGLGSNYNRVVMFTARFQF